MWNFHFKVKIQIGETPLTLLLNSSLLPGRWQKKLFFLLFLHQVTKETYDIHSSRFEARCRLSIPAIPMDQFSKTLFACFNSAVKRSPSKWSNSNIFSTDCFKDAFRFVSVPSNVIWSWRCPTTTLVTSEKNMKYIHIVILKITHNFSLRILILSKTNVAEKTNWIESKFNWSSNYSNI